MPRIIASIEARMAASRLPGKMLMDINGRPAIQMLVERLRKARLLDGIVLASTVNPLDDALEDWARSVDLPIYRGSETDVLQRVIDAQAYMDSDIVVEICGDCPLLDPSVVDQAIEVFLDLKPGSNVVTTTQRPSYPSGLDVQVFRFSDLEEVARIIDDPAVHEHVSLYFYEHPEQYKIVHLEAPVECRMPDQRCQLDYEDDLTFICAVTENLEPTLGLDFGAKEIVTLLKANPDIIEINNHCEEKAVR